MNVRIATLAIGLSLAFSVARAVDQLNITETGENFNDLKATFNGNPFAIALTGAADAWTVQLPSGYTFEDVGLSFFFPEPDNPNLFNEVSFTQPTFMLFSSEIPAEQTFGTSEPNPFTILDGGTGPTGAEFNLTLADAPARAVPDTSSTLTLLGVALAGLAFFGMSARCLRVLA